MFAKRVCFKKLFFSKKIIAILLTAFLSAAFVYSQESEVTTITIENSMQTSYKKSEDGSEDLIELEGAVEISVKKGSNKTSIKADKVTYNRATEMLFASGNVEIVTEGASAGGEKTTANSLLMNTSTLEGVFDGGRVVQTKSDALNLPSGSTLIVFSDLFGKSQSNTISFKNSKLTFCDDEDPHWHIDATRTWLLPGGEFAFFNALLYVGPVPVLYLPAFYYPKDELIFNPVFSKSDRKGFTVQNTYYILGRKPLQSSSSSSSSEETTSSAEALKGLYNFMKPTTLKEQERQGLILHNLDENYSGTTSTYLKVMADYYSKLGYFAGLEGVFQPKNKNITNLKFNVDLGFSKTLFANNNYSFISSKEKTYWDRSNFMGLQVPFRYGANLELSLAKPFRTTIQMPLYTDPFFYYDFMVRQESMDWISYFLQGDDTTSSQSEYSTFAWKISNSYSPTLPAALKPYISSLSIKLDSSLSFGTATASFDKSDKDRIKDNIANGDSWSSYTPERKFYYPTEVTPATASVSLSGTIFQWPLSSSTAKKETVKYTVPLVQPEELMTEKQLAQKKEKELEEQKKQQEQAENDGESSEKQAEQSEQAKTEQQENDTESEEKAPETEENPENALLKNLLVKLPEFSSSSSSSVTVPTGLSYSLGYSIAPTVTTKFSYGTTEPYIVNEATGAESTRTYLNTQEDFDWTKIKSFMYTYKMPTSLSSNLKYGGNYFTMTNKFSWDPILQGHPNTDGVTTSEKKSLILADHKAESQTISNTNTISFKPFSYVPMFADTGISWNTTLKLFRRDFKGTSSDTNWETYWKSSDAWESYWLHDYWDEEKWINGDEAWDTYDDNKKEEIQKAYQRKIITTNTVNFTLGANELNNKFKQNFTWSMTLPPQQVKHSLSLNLTFPYVSSSFSWSFQERASSSSTDTEEANKSKYEYNTLSQALSLNLFNSSLKLSESLSLTTDSDKLEKDNRTGMDILDSMKVSLSWKRITAAYTMSYTQNYELDKAQGWIAKTNSEGKNYKEFIPYSLSFSWSPETKTYYKWSKKISFAPGLSTSVIADLIRPTNSYLTFSPSLNFKINELLTLSFSATSRNSTLYWYFQGKDSIYNDCGSWFVPQFFGDLFRSFGMAFGEASKGGFTENREASGFKLKSLSMTASHDLHDWSFNMTWKFEPKLVKKDGQYIYNFDPYISIGIVWKPMDSMKTTIVSEYNKTKEKKVWELNPK